MTQFLSGSSRHAACVLASLGCVAGLSRAQSCDMWLPGGSAPGVMGNVQALTMWDADGAGPAAPRLVVGGSFLGAGATYARNLATWNGQEWSMLAGGSSGQVRALWVTTQNALVAAGTFTRAGTQTVQNLAMLREGATDWQPIGNWQGSGPAKFVNMPDGSLVAIGGFSSPFGMVARWDGAVWARVGGMTGGDYICGDLAPDGSLVVGGKFGATVGTPMRSVARWNGTAWSSLITVVDAAAPQVQWLLCLPDGRVVVAGTFTQFNGVAASNVAIWQNGVWSAMGAGVSSAGPLTLRPDGRVGMWRLTPAAGQPAGLYEFDGSAWTLRQAAGVSSFNVALEVGADTYLGGGFVATQNTFDAQGIARLRDGVWSMLGDPASMNVGAVQERIPAENDQLVVAGFFERLQGENTPNYARFDPLTQRWSALSPQPGWPFNSDWSHFTINLNGELLHHPRLPNSIYRWQNNAWTPFASVAGSGNVVVIRHLGRALYAVGGQFRITPGGPGNIALLENGTWQTLGPGLAFSFDGLNDAVVDVIGLPSGELVAAGRLFLQSQYHAVLSWNGTQWGPVGAGLPLATALESAAGSALHLAPDGTLWLGGSFLAQASDGIADSVAQLRDGVWYKAGDGLQSGQFSGLVEDIEHDSRGNIYVSGTFDRTGQRPLGSRIARWNGGRWQAIGAVTGSYSPSIKIMHNDDIFVLGGVNPTSPTGNFGFLRLCPCDSIDFNGNAVFPEDQDLIDFLSVLAGDTPSTCDAVQGCNDIDFNNNGVFPEDQDVIDFFNVLAGGTCG